MRKFFISGQFLLLVFITSLVVGISSPFWLWHLKPNENLEVLIFDKTVPDATYREHKGLVWVLNNLKYVQENGDRYSLSTDYVGFKPVDEQDYKIDGLPEDLSRYDVFYLADQYGVYEEEFYGENLEGKRSDILYGGLQEEEVDRLNTELLSTGKTLVAEFNTFGSPTEEAVRTKISNMLNVTWSGWNGRYFTDLNSTEVPLWVKNNYERSNGKWNFKGPGLVFVNRDDYVTVVDSSQLEKNGVVFEFTKEGSRQLGEKQSKILYQYWFDIVDARDEEEVLATYTLPVKDEAKQMLTALGIPLDFPAVIHHRNASYSSYYFAGDYADEAEVPGIYQTRGISYWKQLFDRSGSFFWKGYFPMMKNILEDGLAQKLEQQKVEVVTDGGVRLNSQTTDSYIQVQKDGKWEDLLIKGVNMGIAKPGFFPGETAITKAEYVRWFKAIGDMNANALRIYTLHPPTFYEAFYEYNQTAEEPLFLFHGAWVNEEELVASQNAFSEKIMTEFQREMKEMVDIVHGNATLPDRVGHASGEYRFDISKYVLGYVIGIEWDPHVAFNTNEKNKGMEQYSGEFFKTEGAEPFEIWLAKMMDYTAQYEMEEYQWQHSMSFTNWVTTDLLEHPSEPSEEEDMVAVNPNHIQKTDKFKAGMFASYHIYPYYPDFLNYDEKYLEYVDRSDQKNNYAGYLHDLIQAHEMPVVVAEFGVPSSRGLTHENPYGMNQGFLSEEEQGEINKHLFSSIVSEGYAGGLVFSWQNEWFKRTWNTMDLDNPDRRPYWSNLQTNEQNFGLLSFEPDQYGSSLYVDGAKQDWLKKNSQPAYQTSDQEELVQEVHFSSDAAYLYFRLDFGKPINWDEHHTYLMIDSISGQGQLSPLLNEGIGVSSDSGFDFVIELKGPENSRVIVDSYYDSFYYLYGEQLNMIDKAPYASTKNNGHFHPIRLALNKELVIPTNQRKIPFKAYETGVLKFGNANPLSKEYNSLTDVSISEDKKTVEGRIAWQLLNIKDPSLKEIQADLWESGLKGSTNIEGIGFGVVATENGEVRSIFPKAENLHINGSDLYMYKWAEWNEPKYHERLKKSYYIMKEAYQNIQLKGKE